MSADDQTGWLMGDAVWKSLIAAHYKREAYWEQLKRDDIACDEARSIELSGWEDQVPSWDGNLHD